MVTCEVCGKDYKTNSGLSAHIRAKHPVVRPLTTVLAAVQADLAGVNGSQALQASTAALAAAMDETTSARDLVALARELREHLKQLNVGVDDQAEEVDSVDDLAKRRAARRAEAEDRSRATSADE